MAADPSLKGAFTICSYKPPPKSWLLDSGSVVPLWNVQGTICRDNFDGGLL
jgi:hypothetical protein